MKKLLVILALVSTALAQPGFEPEDLALLKPLQPEASSYVPDTAGFDGSNDYLTSTASSAGISSANTLTFACWLDFTGGDGVRQDIWWTSASRSVVFKNTANQIEIVFYSGGGTLRLAATSSVTKAAADGWFHLLITADTADTAKRKFYFNGTEDTGVTWSTYSSATTMQLGWGGSPSARIGAGGSALNKLNASIAELYHSSRYLNDPSKFISGGLPVSLGTDGSAPDGSAPGIYFSRAGSGDAWNSDSSGNANAFTLTGALGSPSPP